MISSMSSVGRGTGCGFVLLVGGLSFDVVLWEVDWGERSRFVREDLMSWDFADWRRAVWRACR